MFTIEVCTISLITIALFSQKSSKELMLLHISKQKKLYKYELVIMYVDILYYYARTNFFLNCD